MWHWASLLGTAGGQGHRKVVSPEVDISRVAAASAKWTLAAGPWEQQQVPGSLLCDILQEVTLVDLQLAVQCTLFFGGILVLSTAFTPAPACYHTMRGIVGTVWQSATERRVQIALKPSACPFLLCVLTLIRLWLHCALCA